MTSLVVACALLAVLFCVSLSVLARTRAKLRRLRGRVERLEAQNAAAFEWGRSVGVAKGLSGRWLRFETDGMLLKHIDLVSDTEKHN